MIILKDYLEEKEAMGFCSKPPYIQYPVYRYTTEEGKYMDQFPGLLPYLDEKIAIGLLTQRSTLYMRKWYEDTDYRIILYGVRSRILEKVIKPGMQNYVNVLGSVRISARNYAVNFNKRE